MFIRQCTHNDKPHTKEKITENRLDVFQKFLDLECDLSKVEYHYQQMSETRTGSKALYGYLKPRDIKLPAEKLTQLIQKRTAQKWFLQMRNVQILANIYT